MAIDHFWCQGNYLNADKQQYECKTLKYKTKKSLRQLRSKTGGSLGENDNFPVMKNIKMHKKMIFIILEQISERLIFFYNDS